MCVLSVLIAYVVLMTSAMVAFVRSTPISILLASSVFLCWLCSPTILPCFRRVYTHLFVVVFLATLAPPWVLLSPHLTFVDDKAWQASAGWPAEENKNGRPKAVKVLNRHLRVS